MRIVLLCEGDPERALKGALKEYLDKWCKEQRLQPVGLDVKPVRHALECEELRMRLDQYAQRQKVLGVIALTDVYPTFEDARAAKEYLADCVKDSPFAGKFFSHAARYELEAWLLPFWADICKRLNVNAKPPGADPEQVNDQKPPSHHLKQLYGRGRRRRAYDKVSEATKVLNRHRIEDAAGLCPELQAMLETLRTLCRTGQA